jgi:PAP2 superfamily
VQTLGIGMVMVTRRWWHSRFGASLVRELTLVLALLAIYKYGRFLGRDHVNTALRNARDVIGIERSLGVFTEARFQDLVLSDTAIIRFLNAYYLVAHVVVTAATFIWLYARHPSTYRRFRNVMVVITLAGLTMHLLLPLAPPRMFPHLGFVDTAKVFGPASYGAGSPYKGFANQFAAMPSLHFGWALVVAWAVLLATKSRWRYLIVLHPIVTLAAIVLTANHYWIDAFAATVLFGFALVIDHVIEKLRRRKLEHAAEAALGVGSPDNRYRPREPQTSTGAGSRCDRAHARD